MALPFDISTSLWFMPTAVWEWETVPPPPPEGAACDTAEGSAPAAAEGAAEPTRRLVFKGYVNSSQFHWVFAESMVSRPWIENHIDDDPERKARPAEAAPPVAPDSTHGDTGPER